MSVPVEKNKRIIGYAFVVADLLHYGHLNFFKECKKHCDVLIVGVYTDELTESYKRKPIIPFEYRIELIKSMSTYVNLVIPIEHRSCVPALKRLEDDGWTVTKLFHGTDWDAEKDKDLKVSKEYIEGIGGELIQPEYFEDISTTKIIEKIVRIYGK